MRVVLRWVRKHKVWTGIILFVLISWLLGVLGLDVFAVGRIIGLIGFFVLLAWLITRGSKRR